MKVLLRLFKTTDKAADGSQIPRRSVEEYLAGDDYKLVIADKLGLGGVTHKDRRVSAEHKGTVGPDDQVLISDNATHYFTKIFMLDNDPSVYGEIEFFDPELFSGKRKETIQNIIGLLKSGVKLPVSIVIHALWSPSEVAERIIRIKGVDFTMNNSFPDAGPIKVFSKDDTQGNSVEVIKVYSTSSQGAVRSVEKSFSAEMVNLYGEGHLDEPGSRGHLRPEPGSRGERGNVRHGSEDDKVQDSLDNIEKKIDELKAPLEEIQENTSKSNVVDDSNISVEPKLDSAKEELTEDNKEYSRSEIIQKFGLNSYEAQATKSFAIITESQLKDLVDQMKANNPDLLNIESKPAKFDIDLEDNEFLDNLYEELKSVADTELQKDELGKLLHGNSPSLSQILASVPKDEPNRRELLKVKLNEYFRALPEVAIFSTINSVKDRVYLAKYPRLAVFNRIMRIYRSYWRESNQSLSSKEIKLFENLVIQDLNLLMRNISKRILSGGDLTVIYGMQQLSDEPIVVAAKALSQIYRQVLIAERILGFIPEQKYKAYVGALTAYYNAVLTWIEEKPVNVNITLNDRIIK